MSHINNQTQDLNSIELVQDLDHEAAASVSGGVLTLSSAFNGNGTRRTYTGRTPSLGVLNNAASWYNVTGNRDWLAYPLRNFGGTPIRLRAGTVGNFSGVRNNNVESVRPA